MDQALLQRRLQSGPPSCSPQCSAGQRVPNLHSPRISNKRKSRSRSLPVAQAATKAKEARKKYSAPSIDLSLERPWKYTLPSLDDLAREGWELKVTDWPAFWEMCQRWLEYESDTSTPEWERDGESPTTSQLQYQDPDHTELVEARKQYYEGWFEIRDRDQVVHALNIVSATVEEIADAGVPMPTQLAYLDPIGKFFHPRRGRDFIWKRPVAWEQPPEPEFEYPDRPWEEWDDFGLRVHMEKVRQKEEKYEAFQRRLDEVGKYQHMEVTPETDLRLAAQQPEGIPSVDLSHEEIMKVITKNGTCVDPFEVPVDIEDPESIPDIMNEVKWHEEMEDFIKNMGRWVESEDDLDGNDPDGDATMSDQFDDVGDAFNKQTGEAAGGGSEVPTLTDEEEPTTSATMDSDFE